MKLETTPGVRSPMNTRVLKNSGTMIGTVTYTPGSESHHFLYAGMVTSSILRELADEIDRVDGRPMVIEDDGCICTECKRHRDEDPWA